MNCYVLAGGRSRRMGESKTALFLDRILGAAIPVFDDVIAVQRPDGEPLSIRTIFEEPHHGAGPLFGIQRALQDSGSPAFILAVDYPLISSEVLRWLVQRRGVPVWQGRAQPLCAVYEPALLPLIERRIANGQRDVAGLIEEARMEMIAEAELRARFGGEPLMNVNTPEELEQAEAADGR